MTDHDSADRATAGSTSDATTSEVGYADAMAEIDAILDELSDDGIDIDVLSARVARAAELIAVCRARISAAQHQVEGIVNAMTSATEGVSATESGTSATHQRALPREDA